MKITEKLAEGIQFDLTHPLSDEVKTALNILLGNEQSYMFHYEGDSWIYWNGSDGEFRKKRIQKYNTAKCKEQDYTISEYKKRYKSYSEVEFEDDSFINIGSQVVSCKNDGKIYIRIVPFGINFDEMMELKIGNNAYYVVYDIMSKKVELGFSDMFDINRVISEKERESCLEYPFLQEETYDHENMEFGYDFGFGDDPTDVIYQILNVYEPKISCWPFSYSVLEEIHMVKRQIEYPIYANPEARRRIEDFKLYSLEEYEAFGLYPKEYDLYRFLGVSNYPEEKIFLREIASIRKWESIINDNDLHELIRYYSEIREIAIGTADIEYFFDIFNISNSSPQEIIRFVLGGVAEEGLKLRETLRNVKDLTEHGQINSWKGRYSPRLLQKNNMRNTTKISKEVLDLLEKKPTLDNLYRQLVSGKEA